MTAPIVRAHGSVEIGQMPDPSSGVLTAAAAALVRPVGLSQLNSDLLGLVTRHLSRKQSIRLAATCKAICRHFAEGVRLLPSQPVELKVSVFNAQVLDLFRGGAPQLEQFAERGPVRLRFCEQAAFDQFEPYRSARVQALEMPVLDVSTLCSRVLGALTQLPSLCELTLRLDGRHRAAHDVRDIDYSVIHHCNFPQNTSTRLRSLELTDFRLNRPGEFLQNAASAFPNLSSIAVALRNPVSASSNYVPLGLSELSQFARQVPRLRQFEMWFSSSDLTPIEVLHALKPVLPSLQSLTLRVGHANSRPAETPDWLDLHPDWVGDALAILSVHAPNLTSLCFRNYEIRTVFWSISDRCIKHFLMDRPALSLLNLGQGVRMSATAKDLVLEQMRAGRSPTSGLPRIADDYGALEFRVNA